jgi:hypothetical protein
LNIHTKLSSPPTHTHRKPQALQQRSCRPKAKAQSQHTHTHMHTHTGSIHSRHTRRGKAMVRVLNSILVHFLIVSMLSPRELSLSVQKPSASKPLPLECEMAEAEELGLHPPPLTPRTGLKRNSRALFLGSLCLKISQ